LIVVDTSAVVASLAGEPDAPGYRAALTTANAVVMSAFNVFECRAILGGRYDDAMLREFDLLLAKLPVRVAPFDADQATLAHRAYQRFGKGTGHAARLNLGDRAAYALARSLGVPLLFKGNDFSRTDILTALDPDVRQH
jgi:ribonuclease VapC